jgi:glycine cleavage system regulatory protein
LDLTGEDYQMKRLSLVMTLLGRDRPGLVEAIASVVAEHGGNWEESRMSHLAGQFAGILRVEVDADQAEPLVGALRSLSREGLELVIHRDSAAAPGKGGHAVHVDLIGQDRPGIVQQISRVIARAGFNVEELSSECGGAPMSGGVLFRARARLTATAAGSTERLRSELEKLAADMMVDIQMVEDEQE